MKGAGLPELIVYQNERKVFRLPLDADRLSIGRSSQCDLILTGDQVSRLHAILEKKDGAFWLQDCSSLGTLLNDDFIKTKTILKDGQKIKISDWILNYHESSPVLETERQLRETQITAIKNQSNGDDTQIIEFDPMNKIKILRPMLVIEDGTGQKHHLVKKKKLVVGTSTECDIVISDSYVSKLHLEFRLSDRGFHVMDLNSTNGTFIKGSQIKESYLTIDEELFIGNSKILIQFNKEEEIELDPYPEKMFCGICGQSRPMRLLYRQIEKIAATDMTVLILGETGTGKEMVARAIHDLSLRKQKPYVVLNCGAISPQLVESELFGHEKGAFTGADRKHIGAFEQAHGGTLFLDEIGELPLDVQAKILRVLEYQVLKRVGGNQEIKVDVRVIAATHRDLSRMVRSKEFREDLFYRLYILPINVPPLRERRDDIRLLVRYFLDKYSHHQDVLIDPEAIEKLKNHAWPGNIRELKNTILRAIAFCDGAVISSDDIEIVNSIVTEKSQATANKPAKKTILNPDAKMKFEKERILNAFHSAEGDKAKAAQILGIGRSTFFRKIKDLGIEFDD